MAEQVIIEQAADGAATMGGRTLVAATDVKLADVNASRDRLIVSADTADAFLSYGAVAAIAAKGVRVKAGGAPWVEEHWKGEVHIISSGAAVICVTETSFQAGDDQGERPTGADAFVPSGPGDAAIPPPTTPGSIPPPPLDPSQ